MFAARRSAHADIDGGVASALSPSAAALVDAFNLYVNAAVEGERSRMRRRLPRLDEATDVLIDTWLLDLLDRLLLDRARRLAGEDPATLIKVAELMRIGPYGDSHREW